MKDVPPLLERELPKQVPCANCGYRTKEHWAVDENNPFCSQTCWTLYQEVREAA